jgi:competence protein ComEC
MILRSVHVVVFLFMALLFVPTHSVVAAALSATERSVISTATPTTTPQATVTGVVIRNANLRAGPGTTYEIVRGARAGDTVEIVGTNEDGGWFYLSSGEWVASFLVGDLSEEPPLLSSLTPSGTMTVHFIDVGQGDSTLLIGPDFTILIDAGRHNSNAVAPYLEDAGVTSIDLLVGTHPHADHIGQFPQILSSFPVAEVWMSGDEHTSLTFERAIDAILASDAAYHEPRAGEIYEIGSATVQVLNPATLTGNFHQGSIALRIMFGDIAFLFTGDAEAETEYAMIARADTLQAEILQLGHHGSRTSSSRAFLLAVEPELTIWSAGKANSYGHPHAEVITRLEALGIAVCGTADFGSLIVTTNGQAYTVDNSNCLETESLALSAPTPTQTVISAGASSSVTAVAPTTAPETAPRATTAPVATPAPTTAPAATATPAPTATPLPPAPPSNCVNINTASHENLQRIIHIGPVRATELISLRPFASVDHLTRVNGIAAGRLRDIKAQGLACVN